MSNISPSRSLSPGAVRMPRYRKQRRQGLTSVRILLDETDVDAFIRLGLLKEDQRQDEEALRTAVMTLVYRAEDDLAGRVTVARLFLLPAPCQNQPQISPIFISDKVTLHVSREEDGKLHLVDAGWDDAKVVQPRRRASSEAVTREAPPEAT